jgi:geranylgeranyl transferase type-1 subunit beta
MSTLENGTESEGSPFKKHARNLSFFLSSLPCDDRLAGFDTQKLILVFFAITSCDVMNLLDVCFKAAPRTSLIEWIYGLQIFNRIGTKEANGGFRASLWLVPSAHESIEHYDELHVTMTHVALLTLLTLEDDLSKVNRRLVTQTIGRLQNKQTGCFASSLSQGEEDMRFVYSAISVCYIMDDFSSVNVELCCQFVLDSLSYEGAFGQKPGGEAHAGSTYLALASLSLMGRVDRLSSTQKHRLVDWLVMRQVCGFNGRPNKDEDTCYSFWVGASLAILDSHHLIDLPAVHLFIQSCEGGASGGFKKTADAQADPLHSHFVISALALHPDTAFKQGCELKSLNACLDVADIHHRRLKLIHEAWRVSDCS